MIILSECHYLNDNLLRVQEIFEYAKRIHFGKLSPVGLSHFSSFDAAARDSRPE